MNINLHIYKHEDDNAEVLEHLEHIQESINILVNQGNLMATALETLEAAVQAEVTRNTTVDDSIIALLNVLAKQVEALKTNPAKLQEWADALRASSDKTVAAVLANTPVDPAPPPV